MPSLACVWDLGGRRENARGVQVGVGEARLVAVVEVGARAHDDVVVGVEDVPEGVEREIQEGPLPELAVDVVVVDAVVASFRPGPALDKLAEAEALRDEGRFQRRLVRVHDLASTSGAERLKHVREALSLDLSSESLQVSPDSQRFQKLISLGPS